MARVCIQCMFFFFFTFFLFVPNILAQTPVMYAQLETDTNEQEYQINAQTGIWNIAKFALAMTIIASIIQANHLIEKTTSM